MRRGRRVPAEKLAAYRPGCDAHGRKRSSLFPYTPTMSATDLETCGFTEDEWGAARTWADYLPAVSDKREIWASYTRRARIEEEALHRLRNLPGKRRVLVLTADWCGDAARSVPVLAAAFDAAEGAIEHRYLDTDSHPRTLDRYLTHGGRAVPLAIVQDDTGRTLGPWGPRPAPLQALLRARKRELGPPTPETKGTWYAPLLAWYAKDGGKTAVEEILMHLERGGQPR